VWLSPTGSINLGFITKGRLAAVLITPSLGVPNWSVIYINTAPSTSFLAPLPRRKMTSARGFSHAQSLLCFCFALFYFCLHIFIKNIKKISFLYSCFYLLDFSLARMSNPEVEAHTFKQ
jgi:hypothetical protein